MIYAIKTKDGYYTNHQYFEGGTEPAQLEGWYFTKSIDKPLKKVARKTRSVYKLKEAYSGISGSIPEVCYSYDEIEGRDDLYDYNQEVVEEERFDPLEDEVKIIKEDPDWNFYPNERWNTILHKPLDWISTPKVLLQEKECSLTKKETFDIIRDYVKVNIDPNYAQITSDYDFCFTVKKKIELYENEKYTVDINNNIFSKRKRKAKYVTKYRTHRFVDVFECAPKPYQDYTVVKPFQGKNYKDLENNIRVYLEDLIKKINEPVKDCKCCKGRGVIIEK